MHFLPEVGISEWFAGIQGRARVGVAQDDLRPARSLKVGRLVMRREVVSGYVVNRNKLLNTRIVDSRAEEVEEKRATTLVEVARIEHESDSLSKVVGPVEASVQDVEAEIAVHHQVVLGGQVSGNAKKVRRLLPGRHGGVGTMDSNEIVHVIIQIVVVEFHVQLSKPLPGLDGAFGFLLILQECEKVDQGIGAGRHHLEKKSVRVRTHAPAFTQGG